MTSRILVGDCLALMPTLGDGVVDAIVTDPPYGLGFMGKAWDHGVPGVQFWRAALHALRPGGYLLAFGGTRTFHRLAVAIEDAGFELHDTLSWLYGSGFPKHRSKLKPGWEPIILGRRPAKKATELNIDACRIAVVDDNYARNHSGDRGHAGTRTAEQEGATDIRAGGGSAHDGGRWPANVVLDEGAAALLDDQSGVLTSGANPTRRGSDKFRNTYGDFEGQAECEPARGVDVGGASRFYYCAKASQAERNAGLDAQPERLHGISGGAAAAAAGKDYAAAQTIGLNRVQRVKNDHPTIKPIALMRWLCRLVTPAGGVVLDPFTGSGSTGIAARLEGLGFIGIEIDPHYALLATERIAHHEKDAA